MHDFMSEERDAGLWGEAAEVSRLALQALNTLAARGLPTRAAHRPLFAQFIAQAADGDHAAFRQTVDQMRRGRISPRTIIDSYVPEAARRLGDDWVSDRRSFAEVTIGCAALQSLVRTLSAECDPLSPSESVADVLLAVPAGEDHTLGAVVAASWLRRNGAAVALRLQPSGEELCEIAAKGGFDIIMLSCADTEGLEKLSALVKQLRGSLARGTPILVGGAVVGRVGGIEQTTGADLATNDLELAMSRFAPVRLSPQPHPFPKRA
jgi:methanogenic corrinoid protein MtbC1